MPPIRLELIDPIDEANAYASFLDAQGESVESLAARIGVSVQRIENRLSLLDLVSDAQALVRSRQLTVGYARVLAVAGLDGTRQRMALAALSDRSRPTLGWFRQIVAALVMEQAQDTLFDLPLLNEAPAQRLSIHLPPDPARGDAPLRQSGGVTSVLTSHINFWLDAARQWSALGRPAKARECKAAAHGLDRALKSLRGDFFRL